MITLPGSPQKVVLNFCLTLFRAGYLNFLFNIKGAECFSDFLKIIRRKLSVPSVLHQFPKNHYDLSYSFFRG